MDVVHIAWGHADDEGLLRRVVAAALDVSVAEIVEGRVCPDCGASDHGRPFLRAGGRRAGWASLSRHGDHAVAAWCASAPVGVDVDADPAWAHREARGKAVGTGITGDDPLHVASRDIDAPDGCAAAVACVADEWQVVTAGRAAAVRRATG
ncbi:MAG: hypothetical protein QM621_06545 [Aeromicrobium sp.]|uniref:hypothetical protein n=1 Tax=Aeromicrobium sp. TaxID=1871063 RepID=UPI0039E57F7B